jgi:hypothetical protein
MPLKLRKNNGSDPLTWNELDGNFEYFAGSHAVTGSLVLSGSGATPLVLVGNLQTFTTNAAALSAGLPVGAIYINGDYDPPVLSIVY